MGQPTGRNETKRTLGTGLGHLKKARPSPQVCSAVGRREQYKGEQLPVSLQRSQSRRRICFPPSFQGFLLGKSTFPTRAERKASKLDDASWRELLDRDGSALRIC